MKATINSAKFKREWQGKHGTLFDFEIKYTNGSGVEKVGYYSSTKKDQDKFAAGKEVEFEEIEMQGKSGMFYKLKPTYSKGGHSFRSKSVQREQARYSAFSMSYAKDLVIAGIITEKQMFATSKKMFEHMVELDKTLLDDNS